MTSMEIIRKMFELPYQVCSFEGFREGSGEGQSSDDNFTVRLFSDQNYQLSDIIFFKSDIMLAVGKNFLSLVLLTTFFILFFVSFKVDTVNIITLQLNSNYVL